MYAVTVTFTLKPGTAEAFMPQILLNARSSVANEPGCHQFDVCHNPDTPETVFLYELYTDLAAFEAHQTMPHFKACNEAIDHLVADKQIATFSVVER